MKKLISGILVLSMVLGGLMMLPLMSFAADDDLPVLDPKPYTDYTNSKSTGIL